MGIKRASVFCPSETTENDFARLTTAGAGLKWNDFSHNISLSLVVKESEKNLQPTNFLYTMCMFTLIESR
jgi:hypothetical protein